MKTKHKKSIALPDLISNLKKEDARNIRISKTLQWVYLLFIPFYLIMPNIPFGEEISIYERLSGVSYALGFLAFALIFRNMLKEFSSVDYSLPTIKVMKQVIKRYSLWKPKLLWVLIPILFLDLGVILSVSDIENTGSIWTEKSLLFQPVFFGCIVLGFLIGVVIWKQKQKPLKDHAKILVQEIER